MAARKDRIANVQLGLFISPSPSVFRRLHPFISLVADRAMPPRFVSLFWRRLSLLLEWSAINSAQVEHYAEMCCSL